jgi:hypothetical protein
VPFAYYARLSRRDRATYRKSDAVPSLPVPGVEALRPAVDALRSALEADEGARVARASFALCAGISGALGARPPELRILAVRPRAEHGELHGLYTPGEETPCIRVWMRTARHARVVAFRTFLRTLLHELVHHLDLEVLGLEWSFHTEGFFQRESSLFHQLVPEPRARGGQGARGAPRQAERDGGS